VGPDAVLANRSPSEDGTSLSSPPTITSSGHVIRFCRTHECELVGDPLRLLRRAGMSARAEHLPLDWRRIRQQAADFIRAAIGDARL
jgi:hypothetical protein